MSGLRSASSVVPLCPTPALFLLLSLPLYLAIVAFFNCNANGRPLLYIERCASHVTIANPGVERQRKSAHVYGDNARVHITPMCCAHYTQLAAAAVESCVLP